MLGVVVTSSIAVVGRGSLVNLLCPFVPDSLVSLVPASLLDEGEHILWLHDRLVESLEVRGFVTFAGAGHAQILLNILQRLRSRNRRYRPDVIGDQHIFVDCFV